MHGGIRNTYRRFAELEARGNSAVYESWANSLALDEEILSLLATLPRAKRQPNLVFASARFAGATAPDYSEFRNWLIANWSRVQSVILQSSTQTNEAGRCAVLLPELSRFEDPLALIEVGASAGLCLYPDLYSYRYQTSQGTYLLDPPMGPSPVQLRCDIPESAIPNRLPRVAWRAGIDLRPVDVRNEQSLRWLESLVWPEQRERLERLRRAAALVADDPPRLTQGDLLQTLPGILEAAPSDTRIVVFHSSVLVYLAPEARKQFVELVQSYPQVTWISNEGREVLPGIQAQVGPAMDGRTIIAVNGRAQALAGAHGQSYWPCPGQQWT